MALARVAIPLAVALLLSAGGLRAEENRARFDTEHALVLCERADRVAPEDRESLLRTGLVLAEGAVEINDHDPRAHFAVFCTLGKIAERARLDLGSLRVVRRLRREIDRTLELDPDYVDALIAKAEMLSRLPTWLGGDPAEASRCLHRARMLVVHTAGASVQLARAEGGRP